MRIDHDLHVHTYLSVCCRDRERQVPANILPIAERMGLKTVGFSDHAWTNPKEEPNGFYRSQGADQMSKLRAELQGLDTPLRVLVGCEADTMSPGRFSITPDFAESLDYVNLACSHFHITGVVEPPPDDRPQSIGQHALRMFKAGVQSGWASTIVHPLLTLGYRAQFEAAMESLSDSQISDAMGRAAEANVAIEITTSFLKRYSDEGGVPTELWSLETPLRLLSLAKDAGCVFVFGSDAHAPERFDLLPELSYFVENLHLTEEDIAPFARGVCA
jgi:histidinol phosphatase-like PHP family hydrolase